MEPTCWVPLAEESPFQLSNLPYGSFSSGAGERKVGVAIGEYVLDAPSAARAVGSSLADLLDSPVLNPLMAGGKKAWQEMRRSLTRWLSDPAFRSAVQPHLHPVEAVTMHLPFEIADYVDFYSSEHHASNAGSIMRPGADPLPRQWKHLPIGYHGRSGTVVVSGTPVARPFGQILVAGEGSPRFCPSGKLDIEAEVGFVVGLPSRLGQPVDLSAFEDHVFGVCLLNDWSARDIQAWEYVPLGPFLGKSFMTSMSPWIVPLAALHAARVAAPQRVPELLPYLDDREHPWGLDIAIEVRINGELVSRPPFAGAYWTAAQQIAHMTSNGASLRTGDLYASGTVSGPEPHQVGSLMELSRDGREPFALADGSRRSYLLDGDEVEITASAPAIGGGRLGFGQVAGRVVRAFLPAS